MRRAGSLLLASALLPAAARAQEQTTAFTLSYRAAEGCPTREHFTSELVARAPWLREAPDDVSLDLAVSFELEPLAGVLVLEDADGQITTRRVPGATCEEVVSALALITTVLIDARRQEAAATASAPSTPPPAPAPARATRAPAPTPVPAPPAAPAEDRPARRSAASPWQFGMGAGAGAQSGVGPDLVLAGSFELTAEWQRSGALRPLLSLVLETSLPQDASAVGGTASLRWTGLRASGCPVATSSGVFVLRPCALFEGGMLDADGTDTDQPDDARAPWWAVGASARAELTLHSSLAVALEGGGRLHLRRDRFYFAPDSQASTAFEVPVASGFMRLALNARW